MKSKVAYIFPLIGVLALSSCELDVNDELERYLSTMTYQKAYDAIINGQMDNSFIEYDNKQDKNELGKTTQKVEFARYTIDETEYYQVKSYNDFYGNKIVDGRTSYDVITSYNFEKGVYETITYENDELLKTKEITQEEGKRAYQDIFYTKFDVYYSGGVYFGDEAIARVRQFEGYFKFNEDDTLTLLGFTNYEGVDYTQYITIDHLGLLLNRTDYMEIISSKTYAEQIMDVKYNMTATLS